MKMNGGVMGMLATGIILGFAWALGNRLSNRVPIV